MVSVSANFLKQCVIDASDCIEKSSSRFIISGGENIETYENCIDMLLNHHSYTQKKTIKEHILDLKISEDFYKSKILDESLNSLKNETNKTLKLFNNKIKKYEDKNISGDEKEWCFVFPVNFNLKCRGKAVLQEFEIYNKKLKLINLTLSD